MKKINLKSTLAVVAVVASCFGAWKAYDTYGSVDNSLMMENIEALSDENPNGEGQGYVWVEERIPSNCTYQFKVDANGKVKVEFLGYNTIEIKGEAGTIIEYTIPNGEIVCRGKEKENVFCLPRECPHYIIQGN